MLASRHGATVMGWKAIAEFFGWLGDLACGMDLYEGRTVHGVAARIDPRTYQTKPPLQAVGA